jgi:Tol biopolymer transport system component
MSNVGNIVWSPDGSRIAFAAADPISLTLPPAGAPLAAIHPTLRDVWLVGVDGSGLKRRTELADGTLALAWSVDGVTIYALGDTGFWRFPVDAGELARIGEPVLTGRVQVLQSK